MDERNGRSTTVWLLDLRRVPEVAAGCFEQRLSASESHRYANFVRSQRKRQFLIGRMLLRVAISNMMNVPVDAITVLDLAGSAPKLWIADGQSAAPNFSISHSGNWVGCALSTEVMLGFDIEVNNPDRDVVALSEAAFQHDERLWLMRRPAAERIAAFYRLWSTHEALYKLMSSLGREMPSLSFGSLVDHGKSQSWHSRALVHQGLTAVVCSDKPISKLGKVDLAGLTPADLRCLAKRCF